MRTRLLEPSWLTLADALAAIDDGRIVDAKTIAGIGGWLAAGTDGVGTPVAHAASR